MNTRRNVIASLELVSRIIAEEYPCSSLLLLELANDLEPVLAKMQSENGDRLALAAHWAEHD